MRILPSRELLSCTSYTCKDSRVQYIMHALHTAQTDIYNKNKVKYWMEKQTSASMKQSQLLRQQETVSYEQDVATNAEGNILLGEDPQV